MFERYTEKARRVVFFARYEASQYGSAHIETEHLLLGLWREDYSIRAALKDTGEDSEIRSEIERHTERGERIPTSVEMPLSADSKKVLLLAGEEASRLGQREVGPEHVFLGVLRVKDSLAARIARERGVSIEEFRERLAKAAPPVSVRKPGLPVLEEFLAGLKWQSADNLKYLFAKNAQVVDVHGKRWKREEIDASFQDIFAAYAKKNASYVIEETPVDSNEHLVAIVLWKNALVASMERVWMHRMTVVLVQEEGNWVIVSLQVTPVQA